MLEYLKMQLAALKKQQAVQREKVDAAIASLNRINGAVVFAEEIIAKFEAEQLDAAAALNVEAARQAGVAAHQTN